MSITVMQILSYLLVILVLVAQWIGILALRGRKNGSWWLMLIGCSIFTLGMVLIILQPWGIGSFIGNAMSAIFIVGTMTSVGNVMFAVGFALHGLMSRRVHERLEQLESVASAMAEELQLLRNPRL